MSEVKDKIKRRKNHHPEITVKFGKRAERPSGIAFFVLLSLRQALTLQRRASSVRAISISAFAFQFLDWAEVNACCKGSH